MAAVMGAPLTLYEPEPVEVMPDTVILVPTEGAVGCGAKLRVADPLLQAADDTTSGCAVAPPVFVQAETTGVW